MSRLALGPTQYPTQWLMRVLSLKVGQQGTRLTTHIHLVPKSRIDGDKSHRPCMPSKHAFGTTIPFTFHPEQATVTQCWHNSLFTTNPKFTTIITRAIKSCLGLTSTHFIKTYLITLPFIIRQLS